ncbi:MAG: folate-binding protein [Rickettsia endosymbiont of Bryobia graminum]|nr:folate-binding protein [Rickettsia endosymbiont of Bryobia graminum]
MYEILTNRSIIEISGEDAMNFIHNLTTNDIKKLGYCYNYALSSQGRYLFDFFVFKKSHEEFLIDIDINQSELFKKHLMIYKLRAKVKITDLSAIYQVIYSTEKLENVEFFSNKDPRYNQLGFRSIISKDLNIQDTIIQELYLQDKYNFAIIDGYQDLIYDRSIPVEYGCEELNAVSYNKGCYIGQEVISRVKYQGVIRKKIFKISSAINITHLKKNEEININNKKIGMVCSTYKNIGIVRIEEYFSFENTIILINNIPVSLSLPPWRK